MKRIYIAPEFVTVQFPHNPLMSDTSEISEGHSNDWDAKGMKFGSWELEEDEEE